MLTLQSRSATLQGQQEAWQGALSIPHCNEQGGEGLWDSDLLNGFSHLHIIY